MSDGDARILLHRKCLLAIYTLESAGVAQEEVTCIALPPISHPPRMTGRNAKYRTIPIGGTTHDPTRTGRTGQSGLRRIF